MRGLSVCAFCTFCAVSQGFSGRESCDERAERAKKANSQAVKSLFGSAISLTPSTVPLSLSGLGRRVVCSSQNYFVSI